MEWHELVLINVISHQSYNPVNLNPIKAPQRALISKVLGKSVSKKCEPIMWQSSQEPTNQLISWNLMDKFDFPLKVHFTSFYEQQSGITKTESPEPGNLFLPYWAPSGDDEIWSGQPCRLDFGDLRRFHLWSSEIQNPKCKLFDYWEIWYYPFFFYFKWFLEQQTVGLQQEEVIEIEI